MQETRVVRADLRRMGRQRQQSFIFGREIVHSLIRDSKPLAKSIHSSLMATSTSDERQGLLSNGNESSSIPNGWGYTSLPMSPLQQMLHQYNSQPEMLSDNVMNNPPPGQMLTRSYSVNIDGTLSHLNPVQLGRHELYQMIPFVAVSGMQQKERYITKAFANYAADIDTLEAAELIYYQTKQHLTAAELSSRKHQSALVLMEELEVDTVVITTPLIVALFVSGISQFLVGYNTSVMNSLSSVVFARHTTFEWSLAVSVFAIGGSFGASVAGLIIDSRGRKGGMGIVIYLFLLGSLIQTFAINMVCITVARFIIGFASGFSSVLVPIYLGELAPPTLRGTLGTLTRFSFVIGIFVSDLLAFPFAKEESYWRILFSVSAVASLVQIICHPFLIESPRWLLSRNRRCIKARHIIKKLRGLRYEHEVEMEVDHFISAAHAQSCDNNDDHTSSGIALASMLLDNQIRRLLICSLVLQMAHQLCGINAVFYYSTMLFEGVIDNPLLGTAIIGGANVVATYVALLLMENTNRRKLILWSAIGMLISCLLSKISSVFWVILFVSFFEIGLGPVPWLIVAEMFEAKYVATAMSVSCQVNWICNFIVSLAFPYLQESLGAYSFIPFAIILLMTIIFVVIFLPETKGTTPEELRDEIVKSISMMLALSNDTATEHYSSSAGNPIDVEWRRAMDDLKRQEEIDMMRGTYNYGFQPISQNRLAGESVSDWKSRISG